jgi:acetyl esterase/lipase
MVDCTRRTLVGAGLALAATLSVPARADGWPAGADGPDLRLVDPELRETARAVWTAQRADPPMSRSALPGQRAQVMKYLTPPLADIPYVERRIPGVMGQPAVTIFVINTDPAKRRPAILHTHGGGFVTGKAILSVRSLQELCRDLDCCAITVDYRLAPDTTYAGSIEDNYAVLKWLHANSRELGVDRARIAVMGESAGGGHAALLAQTAHIRGEVPLAFQCLTYPMVDDRTVVRSVPAQIGNFAWTREQNRFGWTCFLGQAPGTLRVPRRAVPARALDLSGLPPAFIGVGALDLFVEEDISYAQRLLQVGVPTELIVAPGAFHGFDVMVPKAAISRRFAAARVAALRRAFDQ